MASFQPSVRALLALPLSLLVSGSMVACGGVVEREPDLDPYAEDASSEEARWSNASTSDASDSGNSVSVDLPACDCGPGFFVTLVTSSGEFVFDQPPVADLMPAVAEACVADAPAVVTDICGNDVRITACSGQDGCLVIDSKPNGSLFKLSWLDENSILQLKDNEADLWLEEDGSGSFEVRQDGEVTHMGAIAGCALTGLPCD